MQSGPAVRSGLALVLALGAVVSSLARRADDPSALVARYLSTEDRSGRASRGTLRQASCSQPRTFAES